MAFTSGQLGWQTLGQQEAVWASVGRQVGRRRWPPAVKGGWEGFRGLGGPSQSSLRLVPQAAPGSQAGPRYCEPYRAEHARMSHASPRGYLQRKAVVLEYFTHRRRKEKRKKSKGLSAKQRGELRLFLTLNQSSRGMVSFFLPFHVSSVIFLVLSTDLES